MTKPVFTRCVALVLVCLLLAGAAFVRPAAGQANILPGGTLEDFGTQKDAGGKAAANVHDASTATRWESEDPMGQEYFIFSFSGGGSYNFSSLNLYNQGNNKAVKYFQMKYSSSSSASNDPNDSSWQAIPPSGSWVTEKMNLLNINLGATLEDFGTEKDAANSATRVADESTNSKWESERDSNNNYFIFSFAGESVESPDSLVLYNDKAKGVKKFEIFYSSNAAAKTDPDHGSWVQINSTYDANKTNDAQLYTFSPVSCSYFLFKITDQYNNDKVKIKEIELYGSKTLGDGNVWKAEKTTSVQSYTFNQVSGKYFMFKVGSVYDDKKASFNEIELMGSQSGYEIMQWREVIQ